ncbi:MAG TPA: hypothetical protein VEV41_27340 [Terriglobales bacterium]|nr:hypothetical protein [Terriglobales bacterium]
MPRRVRLGARISCGALLLVWPLLAQEGPVDKFLIRMAGIRVGAEEYRISKDASGYKVTSRIPLYELTSSPMIAIQQQQLAPDWSLTQYTLKLSTPGQRRTAEAWRDGGKVQMRVTSGENIRSDATQLRPRTIVLDNFVASHYQILLDAIADGGKDDQNWWVLVPQNLVAVPGKLTVNGQSEGGLSGKPVQVRSYTLHFGEMVVQIWAEAGTNKLMRVLQPAQGLEMIREGFELTSTCPGTAKPQD